MPVSTPTAAVRSAEVHTLRAASSMAIAALVDGPLRAATVVAATREMVAMSVHAVEPGLVCLTSRSAARLPCAMVLPGPVPAADTGAPATVGNGRVTLPGIVVGASRWWAVRLPRVAESRVALARSATCAAPVLGPEVLDAAAALAGALHSRALRLDEAVRGLLGLGPGLTPQGDDVLAGALVALRAVHRPAADRLAAEITRARPFERTTAVSAGLLAYAAHGRCVPELSAFLDALGAPGTDLLGARRQLLTIGHTSGAGLCAGVLGALAGPASLAAGAVPAPRRPVTGSVTVTTSRSQS
ncbi:DUF2877 domain-containing protein [Phytoactinopolyspora alkaliphila]|uniref:DUF2877 domain-containing protein n=1 Tax=Phytoactinopolyspora alkaliphila TaxID=1783498 RepID=A0A6N9YGF5_9ACTN|nr:DUF2877 domain-containing protein [Phytoactinopolyspora alkaliphila]NED93959.1 DUF2877 domain-containing protein [Phytoactinopolyspora alkaliphila]